MSPLPSPKDFMAQFGIVAPTSLQAAAGGTPQAGKVMPTPAHVRQAKMSEEFRALLIHYCASCGDAIDLEQVKWRGLATRLGTRESFLQESAEKLNESGELWQDVLWERIRRVNASKIFRDLGWEKLESGAVAKLLQMLEMGSIRDAGELLAVANTARRTIVPSSQPQSQGGPNMSLNVNFNGNHDAELPSAGAKMSIDLSPRAADALQKANERAKLPVGERVIDSQMLTADELRTILKERAHEPLEGTANVTEIEPEANQ